jgi:hypothetical protein
VTNSPVAWRFGEREQDVVAHVEEDAAQVPQPFGDGDGDVDVTTADASSRMM